MKKNICLIIILLLLFLLLAGCRPSALEGVTASPLPTTVTPGIATQLPVNPTQEPVLPTATSTTLPSVDFNPDYSESTPLIDTQQMFVILESLHQLEFRRLTQPGWYLRYDLSENGVQMDDDINMLVHVVDQNGNCQEQMVFFRKNGKVVPFMFMSADGSRGSVDQATGEVYQMDSRYIPPAVCNLKDPGSLAGMGTDYYFLSSFLDGYRLRVEPIGQKPNGNDGYRAWFKRDGEREVFVVQYQSIGPTGGVLMDPETKEFQSITSLSHWDIYDLAGGRPLRAVEELILSNGKTTHWETQHILEYYAELPADLQTAFDQVVAGLEALMK